MVFPLKGAGISAFLATEILLLYSDIVCVYYIIEYGQHKDSASHAVAAYSFHVLYLMAITSHLRATFTDPGYIKKSTARVATPPPVEDDKTKKKKRELVPLDQWSICSKCMSYRPPRSHHCRHCQCCVRRMDHHCAWINNCVGELNYKYFFLFVMYTDMVIGYSFILLLWDWFLNHDKQFASQDTTDKTLTITVLLIVLIFAFFVNGMLVAQILAVICDRTFVETKRYGRPVGWPSRTRYSLISGVMGRGPIIYWFFPCIKPRIPDPVLPSDIEEQIKFV